MAGPVSWSRVCAVARKPVTPPCPHTEGARSDGAALQRRVLDRHDPADHRDLGDRRLRRQGTSEGPSALLPSGRRAASQGQGGWNHLNDLHRGLGLVQLLAHRCVRSLQPLFLLAHLLQLCLVRRPFLPCGRGSSPKGSIHRNLVADTTAQCWIHKVLRGEANAPLSPRSASSYSSTIRNMKAEEKVRRLGRSTRGPSPEGRLWLVIVTLLGARSRPAYISLGISSPAVHLSLTQGVSIVSVIGYGVFGLALIVVTRGRLGYEQTPDPVRGHR
ncbi:hypothetical protein BJY14_008450 [Actinomadura luteofluorescens]|uniref:Uncharacterized protein n=1 Tax=Actinomadura luteofluorescens TaxID=46163 RepID=A0A7Y9ER91_9ACTN|nr:hypothetical protein [Actinomadura luteofluorescens]